MGRPSASGLIKEKERGPRLRNLPQRRSATALRRAAEGESTRTVVIALLANIVIAIAKLIAGLASKSTGMLAESAHSAADAVNEVFLAVGLHRDRDLAMTGAIVSCGGRDPNLSAVAVPVVNNQGELLGALTVSGLINRFAPAQIDAARRRLIEASDKLRSKLPRLSEIDLGEINS